MKLFQRLLIAPAALGLVAPLAANADIATPSVELEEINAGAFASATKMTGGSVFTTGFIKDPLDANGANVTTAGKLTSEYNYTINIKSSFTGSDMLTAAIEAGNQDDLAMDSSITGGNGLSVASLYYAFPVGDFSVTAGPRLQQDTVISATTSIYDDGFRLGSSPYSAEGQDGAGAAIEYQGDNGWNGSFSLIGETPAAGNSANSSTVGLFTEEGTDTWTASIGYDADNYGVGVVYKDDDNVDTSIAIGAYFRPDGMPDISVVFDQLRDADAVDSSNLLIGLNYPIGDGDLHGAFQAEDNVGTTENNWELYYKYPVNDGVAIQGGFFIEGNAAANVNDTQGVVVETFFSF